jgi:hypothetical protein
LLLALVKQLSDVDGRDDGLFSSKPNRSQGALADQFPAKPIFHAEMFESLVNRVGRGR